MARFTIHRTDRNHSALVACAERVGMVFVKGPPLDGWTYCYRRDKWMPTEIKHPDREGTKNEYTKKQKKLLAEWKERGLPWWVWRTEADVIRDYEGNQ